MKNQHKKIHTRFVLAYFVCSCMVVCVCQWVSADKEINIRIKMWKEGKKIEFCFIMRCGFGSWIQTSEAAAAALCALRSEQTALCVLHLPTKSNGCRRLRCLCLLGLFIYYYFWYYIFFSFSFRWWPLRNQNHYSENLVKYKSVATWLFGSNAWKTV